MKSTKYISLAAIALMGTLASCDKDNEGYDSNARPNNAVSVNFSVGSLKATRSNAIATDDTQRQFNQGDQIAVSANDQEAVRFQCTSTEDQTWTEAVPNKFLLWKQNEMTFKAYYPATEGTSMTAFTVPTDQSGVDKIALADYMTRQQTCNNENGSDIQMQLQRKMARVIVRISGFGSQYDDDEKTVRNVRIYSEASGIADGNPTGSSTEIQPYAQGNGGQGSTYTALVVPGYGDSGARFIQLSDGEGSTLLVKGIPELEAGNSYTFNLVVGKNRIEVASVTVQDWTTGETLAGGQATEGSAAAATVPDGYVDLGIVVDGKSVYFEKSTSYPTSAWTGISDKTTLPSLEEWIALAEQCYWVWSSSDNGMYVFKAKEGFSNQNGTPASDFGSYDKDNDPCIFLPVTSGNVYGNYWSGNEDGADFAYCLRFYPDYVDPDNYDLVGNGRSVLTVRRSN